jgi:hypothetical protein
MISVVAPLCCSLALLMPSTAGNARGVPPVILRTTVQDPLQPAPRSASSERPVDGRRTKSRGTLAQPTPQPNGSSEPARPLWAATWRPVPSDCELLTPLMFLDGSFIAGRSNPLPDPVAFAARSRTMPSGRAAILWWRYSNSLFAPQQQVDTVSHCFIGDVRPWDSGAVAAVAREWEGWLQQYRVAGGRMDLLVGDCERWGLFCSWSLADGAAARIASDPRSTQTYCGALPFRDLIAGIDVAKVNRTPTSMDYLGWNKAMGTLTGAAMREAVWAPAARQYAGLRGSNFGGVRMLVQPAPDLNGHPQPADNIVGTAASPVCYGAVDGASSGWYIDPSDPTRLSKSGSKRLPRSAWGSFLLDQQMARACRRTDPLVALQPWVALQVWSGDRAGTVGYPSDPSYHDEMVRHLALLGAETILYWNPVSMPQSSGGGATPWTASEHEEAARRLNRVLRDVNRQSGGVVRSTHATNAIRFDAEMVVTGAQRHDGKWVWRTTVREDVVGLRDTRNGRAVSLELDGRGRWDVTSTSVAPAYAPILGTRTSAANQSRH